MSPSTVELTLVSFTPRTAAMLAIPDGQAGSDRVEHVLDRGRRLVLTDEDGGVVRVDLVTCLCSISCMAP